MSFSDLIDAAENGDLSAQQELDARITAHGKVPISEARKKLLKDAHIQENKSPFSPEQIKNIKLELTGKDSMLWMSDEDAQYQRICGILKCLLMILSSRWKRLQIR